MTMMGRIPASSRLVVSMPLLYLMCLVSFIDGSVASSTSTTGLSSRSSSSSHLRQQRRQLQDEPGDDEPMQQQESKSCPVKMLEPPVPGVNPGTNGRPNIVLAVGTSEPPFTQLGSAKDGFPLSGFVVDVGLALKEVCSIDIQFSEAPTATCFTSFGIGERLVEGNVHGCANFLKTPGMRNRQAEFSLPIADNRIPSALLTRLDSNGIPAISGMDDLNGKIIVDVPAIVPNPEELLANINPCTGAKFSSNVQIVTPPSGSVDSADSNDLALKYMLDGNADGLWINARTAESFLCQNVPNGTTPTYNCNLWDGLGTTYAYVQTGIPSTALTGVTLAMSKKGSRLSDILDPCIEKFLLTETYYEICESYGLADTGICFENEFFPSTVGQNMTYPNWAIPTNLLETTDCFTGYCPCDVMGSYNDTTDMNVTDVILTNTTFSNTTTMNETNALEELCISTGGVVTTELCCIGVDAFPSQIVLGACGCSPEDSTEIQVCDCSDEELAFEPMIWGCVNRTAFLDCNEGIWNGQNCTTTTYNETQVSTNVTVLEAVPSDEEEGTTTTTTATRDLEVLCTSTGGQVSTQSCCSGTKPFPSQLLVGSCGCSPSDSQDIQVCDCSSDEQAFSTSWGCINLQDFNNCQNAGGTVVMDTCCDSSDDFPNTCLLGACGCSPTNSKPTLKCLCSNDNQCWNGQECVAS